MPQFGTVIGLQNNTRKQLCCRLAPTLQGVYTNHLWPAEILFTQVYLNYWRKWHVLVFLRIFFRQSLPKRRLFWDRLTTLLLIIALPRAQAGALQLLPHGWPPTLLEGNPRTVLLSAFYSSQKQSLCLQLTTDFDLLICSLEQEYKKMCQTLVAAVALETFTVKHLLKKETSLLPLLSTSYSLFPPNLLPTQTAAQVW